MLLDLVGAIFARRLAARGHSGSSGLWFGLSWFLLVAAPGSVAGLVLLLVFDSAGLLLGLMGLACCFIFGGVACCFCGFKVLFGFWGEFGVCCNLDAGCHLLGCRTL